MVEPEPEKKRKEKMWKRGRVFKERTQYSVWTRLFSTLGAKEQVSESEGKGSLTEKRLFKWGIPSIMKTMNDRLITLEIKYWTAVTGKDDAVQLEVEKKFKDLGPFTGPKTAEDKPCTATKFRTFHKYGSIFKEKEETIGDNIKERIFFKGGTEDSEEVTQKIIEGMDHIKMKIFNKIYRFPIPPENKFVFPDGMINYVRSWGFKKSSDFHHYFQDFVKDISEYAKEYLMDEYERGMEIGLEKATKGFTEIKKDMKNKWKERIDNILEPFLRKVDEVLENEEKIKDALQNIEEETTDEWKENVSEYLPRREIIRLKREFMENIDKIKRKIEKKEEKKEEIKPEEYFEEIKKYVVSLFVNTWEQTYKSVEEKVRDLTRTIEGKTEDGKKDESSKDQIGYGVDVIRDVYINLMDDTFDWIGGEKRMQKGGKTGVDDEGAKTGHEGLLRKYPNIAENIMTNELQEIQEILEANSVSAKAVVVFTHTYEVLMRAKCGREERTIKAFEKVIDATENNKKKILKDYKKIYDRDSYDPTKGRMIDKNIMPLEVATTVYDKYRNIMKYNHFAVILKDHYKYLLGDLEREKVRGITEEEYNECVEEISLLDKWNYINNEWDSYRDDIRDGRYHPKSLTVYDYVPMINNKRKIYSTRNWSQDKIDKVKTVKMKIRSNNELNSWAGEDIDGKEVKLYRKPENLNPAFDMRAMKAVNEDGELPMDKWRHAGRVYYYEDTSRICEYSKKLFKDDEAAMISTRGAAMFIIDFVLKHVKYVESVRKVINEISNETNGFDYGPREVNGILAKDPFDPEDVSAETLNKQNLNL